jgi:hypothetical protein
VFERLGPSLFDFLRMNNYRPLPISIVQQFAKQMLQSVAYLHELNLVHTGKLLLLSIEAARVFPRTRWEEWKRLQAAAAVGFNLVGSGSAQHIECNQN